MANKTLSEVLNEFSNSIVRDVTTLKTVKFSGGKCSAHLYHLERQGDSINSRYIYRCKRNGCRHYSTFTEMEGRMAFCRNCEKPFGIEKQHIIKNYNAKTVEDTFHEYPSCGCDKPVEVKEEPKAENNPLDLSWLNEE